MEEINIQDLDATSNPYLDFYNEFYSKHGHELIDVFDPQVMEEKRLEMYNKLNIAIAMKYAWAIPDERALQIIKHYGPIVEMGAGSGYWAKLLELRGVDVICYDIHTADDENESSSQNEENKLHEDMGQAPTKSHSATDKQESDSDSSDSEESEEEERVQEGHDDESDEEEIEVEQIFWTDVKRGTPKDLKKHSDRTLFLCYPDDFEESEESVALESLLNYTGDTVIHVGELFGQTLCLPGPWGRTSSSEFQVHLASVYHKVLQVPLPSWHSSMDALTVWKRTQSCIMNTSVFAFIPAEERLDLIQTCPSTRHLLDLTNDKNNKERDRKRCRKS